MIALIAPLNSKHTYGCCVTNKSVSQKYKTFSQIGPMLCKTCYVPCSTTKSFIQQQKLINGVEMIISTLEVYKYPFKYAVIILTEIRL